MAVWHTPRVTETQPRVTIEGGRFVRDGEPHQLISGALHYFRVPPALWTDRLQRLAAMGCNTVETYVAWNFHQPFADQEPSFEGDRDLGAFLDRAAEAGLDILVRPGPYICAEWEFGGLPSWLLTDPAVRRALRTSNPLYQDQVDRWFDALIPVITPRQATRGGRVIGIQVENEYGSFGNDTAHLAHLRDRLVELGIDVWQFTSDGPGRLWLQGGTLDGTLATVNFGSRQESAFAALAEHRTGQPEMCMEFWNGWFDHFGGEHHTRAGDDAAAELAGMLEAGRSVNFYMAHGGTSFGVWAGANAVEDGGTVVLQPTISSYDYDAPIAEDGTLTAKYDAFRDVIMKHTGVTPPEPPPLPERLPAGTATVTERVSLAAVLNRQPVIESVTPLTFEELGVHQGVVRYRTSAGGPYPEAKLTLDGLADLGTVIIDDAVRARVGRMPLDDRFPAGPATVELAAQNTVDVLVSSLGRINFGRHLGDSKGLAAVRLDFQHLMGFRQSALDLTSLPELDWTDPEPGPDQPGFHRAELEIERPADGYLALPDWHHGYLFLNGFNLGRYWSIGPQRALYAPAPLWRAGRNELIIAELGGGSGTMIELRDAPDLG